MKVIKNGRPQKGWAKEFTCSGKGNGGGGCGAVLLVEEGDLFHTSRTYMDGEVEYWTTFQCAQCGVLTDLPETESPPKIGRNLPDFKSWQKLQEKIFT
jgi:hypothetical protein